MSFNAKLATNIAREAKEIKNSLQYIIENLKTGDIIFNDELIDELDKLTIHSTLIECYSNRILETEELRYGDNAPWVIMQN